MADTTKAQAERTADTWQGSLSEHRARQADHITGVAMGIIAVDGIAGLSMSTLAEAAGISRQTLYKYFPDVDAVLAAMGAMGSAGIAELAGRVEAEADPRDGLIVFVSAVFAAAAAGHPSPLALVAAVPAVAREAMRAHEDEAERVVVDLLRRGQEVGSFRSDLDPDLDGRIIYRAVLAAHDLAAEDGVDVDALSHHLARDMLRIVEVPPRPSRRPARR